MPKVTVCRGNQNAMMHWTLKRSEVCIDTEVLKFTLNIKDSKLILSIRDTIMIKSLRAGRNVILLGDHSLIEQLERIDEVLQAQGEIDGKDYKWKVKDF